jgi:FKBP-type peptidyl-prolyl cis-trans isomerase 2
MVKNGEFVKLNYTGSSKGKVFDTTLPKIAKDAGISSRKEFKPVVICVGEGMLLKSLDKAIVGKTGSFSIDIPAGQAFGKKNPELLKIVPEKQLHAQQIKPLPGLELNIDGKYGIVRSVSPGRVVVDFNHPLAGQDVTYDLEILNIVTDAKEQIEALLTPLGVPHLGISVEGTKALIKVPQMLPPQIMTALNERITKLTTVKTVSFEQGVKPKK